MKKSKETKRFVCLVYFEGRKLEEMTPAEHATLGADSRAYDELLKKQGHLIVAEALQSPDTSRTVSVRRGKISVTDGPFAETKEQLGGFILVSARSMAQAEKIAAGIPLAKLGRIEVRPIYVM